MTGYFGWRFAQKDQTLFLLNSVDPVNHVYWTQKKNASRRDTEITEIDQADILGGETQRDA